MAFASARVYVRQPAWTERSGPVVQGNRPPPALRWPGTLFAALLLVPGLALTCAGLVAIVFWLVRGAAF